MNTVKNINLACPLDGERLASQETQLVCRNGHTFDIARQGYINLLPVQHKRTKYPGDSKAMVSARTRFLNSGIYEPIARQLAEIVQALIPVGANADNQYTCLVDAGCGEGYYLDYAFNYLQQNTAHDKLSFTGLDISKPAITEASKRNRHITWVVGTNRSPPIETDSVDIILCVFGFQSFDGFNRMLKPGGKVILVEPGPEHLKQLREIIYKQAKKTGSQSSPQLQGTGFSMLDCQSLRFRTGLINNEQINDLLLMTPHFYRANKEGRAIAVKLDKLDLSVDVVFRTLVKQ